jgi:hypothetical protein
MIRRSAGRRAPPRHHGDCSAMLFIAEQRAQRPGLDLLSPRDIVDMLNETLPRKPKGKEALMRPINERHQRRLSASRSRFRAAAKSQPP